MTYFSVCPLPVCIENIEEGSVCYRVVVRGFDSPIVSRYETIAVFDDYDLAVGFIEVIEHYCSVFGMKNIWYEIPELS